MLLAAGLAALPLAGPHTDRPLIPDAVLPEPSGIAWHAKRRTLFAVGDRGDVVELAPDGSVKRSRHVGDLDLEGVTVGPEGRVYAVVEDGPAIVVLDPETLETVRRIEVDPVLDGKRVLCVTDGAGVEGICYAPELKAFFLVNQKEPARLVELAMPEKDGERARVKRIVAELDATVRKCSDLTWDAASRHFLIPSASSKSGKGPGKLFELSEKGEVVRELPLRGERQEGFCLDGEGAAYVACDSGGILKIEGANERGRPPR